ncbi:uncharacterized protein G2W53_020389 [Senna tora]|uniref:Uncharacterized protein n=1 Tax=Senna tora TaxID=362788 RepID=A0A834U0A4_9FABA|nr:uncharacterized protein G2W53_020389 [Senna tora]
MGEFLSLRVRTGHKIGNPNPREPWNE